MAGGIISTQAAVRPRSDLRPYQVDEIARLVAGESRGLFWQMGAGKTGAVLHFLVDAFNAGTLSRALLVSTPTIIRSTWPGEIRDWRETQHLAYVPLIGSPATRQKALAAVAKSDAPAIVAIGFDSVHTIVNCGVDFDILIVDEASMARNPSSRRFRSLIKFAARAKQRVAMTGSPAPNSVTDLFGVVALIDLGAALGTNYTNFLNEHTVQWGENDWQRRDKYGARSAVLGKIGHLCSSIKTSDVVTLPPLTRRIVEVELPPKARATYLAMEDLALNELTQKHVHENASLIKCQQIANGFLYDGKGGCERIHDAKLQAAADIAESAMLEGGSVMFVYNFAADLDALRSKFKAIEVLGGPSATGNPDDIVNRWNAGEIDALALNPRAAGHGLNLQKNPRCSTQIWVSGTWSIELFEQCVARLWRPGQVHQLDIFVIVAAETVDEAVIRVMDRKQDGQAAVMAALKARAAERAAPDRGAAIREARRAAARAHPDAGGSTEAFRAAWDRYKQLTNDASA